MKQIEKYFGKHIYYNSTVHFLIGLGVGILVTYPLIGAHPLRWGVALMVVGILLHLYPLLSKKASKV